jgi:hypothetical protein
MTYPRARRRANIVNFGGGRGRRGEDGDGLLRERMGCYEKRMGYHEKRMGYYEKRMGYYEKRMGYHEERMRVHHLIADRDIRTFSSRAERGEVHRTPTCAMDGVRSCIMYLWR